MKGNTVVFLLLVVAFCLQVCQVDSWLSRRRRRRNPIPPPQNCQVSSWESWSQCSNFCDTGTQSRTRYKTVTESWGGSCPYDLQETRSCGSYKNGCSGPGSNCNPSNGNCYCSSGYYLATAKQCADTNECASNNGRGPCDQVCTNSQGSYTCSCDAGYSLSGKHACTPLDCGAFSLPSCPSNSYQDEFSNVCEKVQSTCPSGTTYLQYCTLSCSSSYSLAKITSQPGKAFGENYTNVDFSSVKSTVKCALRQRGSGVQWDLAQDLGSYYCRRSNDPPHDIALSAATLQEHSSSGTVIGSLSTQDYQSGQSFTYDVLSPSMLFTCQGQSLKSTWKDPDLHGSIPLVDGTINVTIRSTDNGSPQMWKEKIFTITIQDVNDPPLNITLSNQKIAENATLNTTVGVLSAVDGDNAPGSSPSSDFIWTLLDSSNGKFSLSGPKLIVAQKLNHEAAKIHQIKVKCTDRGVPAASSEKTFVISVLDLNEPVTLSLSSSSVLENSPIGTVVGVLKAVDEDDDVVTFNISQSDAITLSKFTLGSTSHSKVGRATTYQTAVEVKGDLDYEKQKSYQLVVQANDKSGQVLQEWTLSVINVNEEPASLNLSGPHTVDENSPTGVIVGDFVVIDPDNLNSITQTHTCSLENSQSGGNNYFMIGSSTVLKVKGGTHVIDYETNEELSITVRCTDNGNPSMSIVRMFYITVKDINELPTSLALSNLTVPENSPIGTIVGTLSCTDPEQAYQSYTYSIMGPDSTPFIIGGPNHTSVIVNGSLDYERTPTLDLDVRVTDSGGLFKEENLKIKLIDMNDPPTDISLPGIGGQLAFKENSGENVMISEIKLVDQDKDTPTCTLVNDASARVAILAGKHLVVGPTMTDYESLADKKVQIKLNCSDGHNAFISRSFKIKILDMNEPITDIKVSNLTVHENQANAMIGVITVIDPDISQSHVCTVCDVIPGGSCNSSQYFMINAALELKTKKALNFEAKHVHEIVINCIDIVTAPMKAMSKEQSFRIVVHDINEEPSSLCPSPFHMSIDDSNGAVIVILQAVDPDNEGSVSNKQSLLYSTNVISDAPFRLRDNRLFKYKNISEPQNYTIDIKVTDDGRVVNGYSSNGYTYATERSLSKVFTCHIIASKSISSSIVNLNPNTVSVMASVGTVIGSLTSKLAEPLTYRLLNNDILPFVVEDNKLKVKKKIVTNYRDFGNRKDLFSYIEIETVGAVSGTKKNGLYVHITNDGPQVPMCLVQSSIGENKPTQTIAGQLLIEDSNPPKHSCSKTSCCSQVNQIAANTFNYQCRVNNPSENSIIAGNNVTNMFYMDERYLLRSKMEFDYQDFLSSKGAVEIRISCHDLARPLHIIGKNFTVNILDCTSDGQCPVSPDCRNCYNGGTCQDTVGSYTCLCKQGYTGRHCRTDIDYCQENPCLNGGTCQDIVTTFNCSCVTGYSGVLCDRESDLCRSCSLDTLCSEFINAGMRCVSREFQAPVLVDKQNPTVREIWEIEKEIADLAYQNKDKNKNKIDIGRKRRSASTFYVETLQSEAYADKTLLRLTIMDSSNNYKPLPAEDACALLAGTKRRCVNNEDCALMNDAGKSCPVIGGTLSHSGGKNVGKPGLSSGGTAGVAISVIFVILAVLIGAIFYYRRKYRRAKQDERPVVNYNTGDQNVEFTNPSYINNATDTEEMVQDRMAKENLVGINLDPVSVRKRRSDIKVTENVLYLAPNQGASSSQSTENPLYAVAGPESRSPKMVNTEQKKAINVKGKEAVLKPGREPVYEDLDAVKKNTKKMSENIEDLDLEKKKMKAQMNSAYGRDMSHEEWEPKHDEEKPNKNSLSEDNRPRYEDSPISFERKPKENHQYENVNAPKHKTPIYDNSPVQPDRDAEKHLYENLSVKPRHDAISGSSIINPVYGQSMEFAEGTGDRASGLEDPLYESIPEKRKKPVDGKAKRRSYLRSVSSEKAGGYEELEKSDQEDEDDKEDAFSASQA
ncbi:cadherin EGF LAG seven-pass G-type receptor 1-like isoform X2 [Actinia tenebrosa]|uniref:Cadherin EGF LAG seven-pass G-type receptor 1-like isoform X2 n=1 Tax=Actinia tenebrosa TaxID=6105 RepID=A0A6P8IT34_ACTTE|nr:cadherin EGF LAG seven-pass G-type receptor 1-like isoform X2 [Actinia tenebrosa]